MLYSPSPLMWLLNWPKGQSASWGWWRCYIINCPANEPVIIISISLILPCSRSCFYSAPDLCRPAMERSEIVPDLLISSWEIFSTTAKPPEYTWQPVVATGNTTYLMQLSKKVTGEKYAKLKTEFSERFKTFCQPVSIWAGTLKSTRDLYLWWPCCSISKGGGGS